MVDDNLIIKNSGVPHIPYHIIDDKGNVIADLFHNIESMSYARLFKNAPRMHKILWDVLENYSDSINNNSVSIKDLKILKDISELQLEILEPIDGRTETSWQDEILERLEKEKLGEIFNSVSQSEKDLSKKKSNKKD